MTWEFIMKSFKSLTKYKTNTKDGNYIIGDEEIMGPQY